MRLKSTKSRGTSSQTRVANALQASSCSFATFWEQHYLRYIEEILPLTGQPRRKLSTVRGFKQIWRQHLQGHFGETTLKDYEPAMGKRFLRSLTGTQGKTTLKHIKALAGSIFGFAVDQEFIKVNSWHDVKIPDDAIEPEASSGKTSMMTP
jgi:hypothetical protein